MSTPAAPSCPAFDVFEVDLRACELYKADAKSSCKSCRFKAALLLERPGEIVRGKNSKKGSGHRTLLDFDHSLNTAIKKLRQALVTTIRSRVSSRRFRSAATVHRHRGAGREALDGREGSTAVSKVGCVAKLCVRPTLIYAGVVDEVRRGKREARCGE